MAPAPPWRMKRGWGIAGYTGRDEVGDGGIGIGGLGRVMDEGMRKGGGREMWLS